MKETLSSSQTKAIASAITAIIAKAKIKMEAKNDEFVQLVSNTWEDSNAVEFAQGHKANMESIITQMGENLKIFLDTLEGIANSYTKVGNMPYISIDKIRITPAILVDKIKEMFSDGNGDDFGFKNPNTAVEQIMKAFEQLKKDLDNIAAEAIQQIKSINAFGNPQVLGALAQAAGRIVEIVHDNIAAAERLLRECLNKTASAYIKTGAAAVASATLGVAGGN